MSKKERLKELTAEYEENEAIIERIHFNILAEGLANLGNRTAGHSADFYYLKEYEQKQVELQEQIEKLKESKDE